MFGFIYRFVAGLILTAFVGLNSGCDFSLLNDRGAQRQPRQNERNNERVNRDNQARGGNAERVNLPIANNEEGRGEANDAGETGGGETNAANGDASTLVGTWQTSYQLNGMSCTAEIIFQSNGGYSSLSECNNGTYMFHAVGYWRELQQGAVRIQYTDYSPKEYGGNPIRIPDGETVYFRVINRNQVESSLGYLYRVG